MAIEQVKNQFWDQTPVLGPGGLQPELLDPTSDLDAEKCTHNSIRSQLHADTYLVHPTIDHSCEMPFGQALKSNMEKINHIDLIF
jgi:methionine synthase I (cobalamin-dependent)